MNHRERNLLVATVVVVVASALQLGVLRPALAGLRTVRTKAILATSEAARLRAIAGSAEANEQVHRQVRSRLIRSSGSPQRDIIDMLLAIEGMAKSAGVEILENSHTRDEQREYFTRHSVRFRGAGKTENLMALLHALESSREVFRVESMQLGVRDNRVQMDLEILRIGVPAEATP